jgi:DNA invertase Pin-like site-specific DNA recombinase
MTLAFAYLRVSGRGQLDGDGFPRQQASIGAYATAHGFQVARTFQEEGVSGTTELDNRPALSELLEALEADGVETVIIEKLDRLARDLGVQEAIIADLRKRGITLVSVHEPDLCSTDPTRVLMRQIIGAIAQYEKSMIVSKLKGARERMKTKQGRCEGVKPFGTFDGESVTLTRMLELRNAGHSLESVAAMLDTEGLKPRTGAHWFAASVGRILKRSAHCGQSAQAAGVC